MAEERLIHGGQDADHEPVMGDDSDDDGWYCETCGADLDLVSA